MATNGGLNIVKDGLVFYYDTVNTKSYKGEPTVNILPENKILLTSYNDHGGTHVTDTSFKLFGNATLKTTSNPAHDWNGVYITGMSSLLTVGLTYTYSFYIYFTSNDTSITYFGYGAPGFTGVQGQWNRVSTTFVATSQDHIYVCLKYSLNQPVTTYYLANLQIEQKSHTTAFTTGNRTNTNSLVSLVSNPVSNVTIDVTNVSFNSNSEITFDGTNDIIILGTGNTFFPLYNFTLEVWIKSPSMGSGMSEGGIFGVTYGLRNFIQTDGSLYFGLYNTSNSTWYGLSSTGVNLFSNTWTHVVCTNNGTTSTIYINGVSNNTVSAPWTGTTAWPTDSVVLGRDNNNNVYYFLGSMQLPKIYNKCLTSTEVLQNYNATKSRFA